MTSPYANVTPGSNPFTQTQDKKRAGAATGGAQDSAQAILQQFLADYGLQALGDWAWQKMLKGESFEQIRLEMRDQPAYQARFPAMSELSKQGRALSEAEYINQEKRYVEVMHAYGLPQGFYDQPQDFTKFMTGNVSPTELNSRVATYSSVVLGDAETLSQLRNLYADQGIPRSAEGDLLAYYLDPGRAAPLLEEQVQAATFASAASRSGFGQLTKAQAETFGAQRDVTAREAEQGFGALVQGRELFEALPGQQEAQIGQDVQLGALFGGDAMAAEKIEKRRAERKAAGAGGGGFTAGRTGAAVGLTSQQV